MRKFLATSILLLSSALSICCFGQIIENPLSNKQTNHTYPLIMIQVYDADAMTATLEESDLNDSYEDPFTPPMHPYGLDIVKVRISSPKGICCLGQSLWNEYGFHKCCLPF